MEYLGIDSNGWVAIATFVIAMATFIAAIVATYTSKKIFEKSNKDEWLKAYQLHYFEFWHNDDLRDVRIAIANDEAYEKMRSILLKRLNDPETISKKEYREIDKIDKFINILTLIRGINPLFSQKDKISEEWFLRYWLLSPKKLNRLELLDYIKLCYASSYHIILEKEWDEGEN